MKTFEDLTKKRPEKPHAIADISYSQDFIECNCSWRGKVDEYRQHRKDLGLTTRSSR